MDIVPQLDFVTLALFSVSLLCFRALGKWHGHLRVGEKAVGLPQGASHFGFLFLVAGNRVSAKLGDEAWRCSALSRRFCI